MNDALTALATGRRESLFQKDIAAREPAIRKALLGRRVLVVGGAGSIGSATVKEILNFLPSCLHVVDTNENQLAELVRDLRSGVRSLPIEDFRTLPIDFGSPIMTRYLANEKPYDFVLNFAALKHVRSEKDIYSLLAMYETNVLKPWRWMAQLRKLNPQVRYFCVSTDKAANPVNLMGASKRLMERVIFEPSLNGGIKVTSARFANVAFSEGSLLQSFLKRFEKDQLLAAPKETRRYFLSQQESGQLCLLAATCASPQSLLIPRLQEARDLVPLDQVATEFIRQKGFVPKIYENEETARQNLVADKASGAYPLLLTSLDTQGEKDFEEFVSAGETADDFGTAELSSITYVNNSDDSAILLEVLGTLEQEIANPNTIFNKEQLLAQVQRVVPGLRHRNSTATLDQRV